MRYDAIYLASSTIYKKLSIRHPRIISSITSWKIMKMNKEEREFFIKAPYAISVNNNGLLAEVKKVRRDAYYLPNCVDIDIFKPKTSGVFPGKKITIGWTGNTNRMEKNYNKIMKPVIKKMKDEVSFKLIKTKKGTVDSEYRDSISMKEYYHGIDFYLNVSSSEGTPNPCLEAASCGVPLISTPVGNMPDLIKQDINGLFIEDSVKSAVMGVRWATKIDSAKYKEMSSSLRNIVEKQWSIDSRRETILGFFSKVRK